MKVIVFPKDNNPYQSLLYGQLEQKIEVHFQTPKVNNRLSLLFVMPATLYHLAQLRRQGYQILHIHFIYPFYLPKRLPLYKLLTYLSVTIFLTLVRLLRFKVVWTVHNVIPQHQVSINDASLMRQLARLADAKIVHASSVLEEMRGLGISTENASVIPIGSYDNIYPDTITASAAREKLSIASDEFVILFFGIVTAYKGTEELVTAFNMLNVPKARLIIVGSCSDETLKFALEQAATHPMIDFYEGFVANEDVATYFKACDLVCLPFRKITTSSSVMLALAFGKPVAAPLLGALRDLPQAVGYFYDVSQPDALQNTLAQAATHSDELPEMGRQGKAYSNSLTWDKIAAKTLAVYAGLLKP
jgi:glycosyltransferase involved in cell wall biosynthesis